MTLLKMEGTADEIAERLHGFAERKLHVTVRLVDEAIAELKDAHSQEDKLAYMAATGREEETTPRKKRAVRIDVMGKYAHLPGSVDEFIQRKQEEIDWEDRRYGDVRP